MGERRLTNAAGSYSPSIVAIAARAGMYPLHRQAGHEILFVEHGGGVIYADGRARRVEQGDLIFISGGATHGFALDIDSRCVLAGVSRDLMPQFTTFVDELNLPFFLAEKALDDSLFNHAIGRLVDRPAAFKTGIRLMSEFSLLLDALATKISNSSKLAQRRQPTLEDRFARAAYSEVDTENPSLDRMASALGTSRTHTSRLIRPTLGLALPAYAAVARVNAAKRLLIQTERPIGKIAQMCHYSSIRTFNRQFLKVAGMTSSEYRERYSPSQVINYDLPAYRPELEQFFERLAKNSSPMSAA